MNIFKFGVLSLTMIATSAFAANDGNLGKSSSTGDIQIQLAVPAQVQIQKLNDINLGSYSTGDMSGSDDFCVYARGSEGSGGNYDITMSSASSNTTGNFELTNSVDNLEYSVTFDDDLTPADGVSMVEGTGLTNQFGSNSRSCKGGNNASIEVSILESDIDAVSKGTYTDVLTIMVSTI